MTTSTGIHTHHGIEPPTMPAVQAGHGGAVNAQADRLTALEMGMQTMQAQLAQLLHSMQPHTQPYPAPLATGFVHPGTPMRASAVWADGLVVQDEMVRKVPGDGDCLWHALATNQLGRDEFPRIPAGKGLNVYPAQCITQAARELTRQGRLLVTQMRDDRGRWSCCITSMPPLVFIVRRQERVLSVDC